MNLISSENLYIGPLAGRARAYPPRAGEEGMTMLETSLAMLFMAMFFAALLATSGVINNMTRGYTCRVISLDHSKSSPERGCIGQNDEVSVDGLNSLNLHNRSAAEALKRDIAKYASKDNPLKKLECLSIKTWVWLSSVDDAACLDDSDPVRQEKLLTIDSMDEQDRAFALKKRCLWEKLEPVGADGTMKAHRNYLLIDHASSDPLQIVNPLGEETDPLPALNDPNGHGGSKHFWFIRSGRLVGERRLISPQTGTYTSYPVPGIQGIPTELLSVDVVDQLRTSRPRPLSGLEALNEVGDPNDELLFAPDQGWGNVNQVCIYQSYALPNLFLLSMERGVDLQGASAREGLFGRTVTGGQKIPALNTVFYVE